MIFRHFDLELVKPDFDSQLMDLIIELDYLRRRQLSGSTHPKIFFQLKGVFHILESWGSLRLEGNRTTIAEYIETKIDKRRKTNENLTEIDNVEKALNFIDKNIRNTTINRAFLSELHKIVTKNLTPPPQGEGSNYPGQLRKENVLIQESKHIPPDFTKVQDYMEEVFKFINTTNETKYDLIKIALTHHRFTWVHPYDNGNGRVVRLLTYAMLVKQGFKVDMGDRIINPTAVFCNDRMKYNSSLSLADTGTTKNLLYWCEYVLSGLKTEIEKIDKLLDYQFLSQKILIPSVKYALDRKAITELEANILTIAIKKQTFKAQDIEHLLKDSIPASRSRYIRKLKDKKLIGSEKENSRKYIINFQNSYLLRGIIEMLDKEGFIAGAH